MYTQIDFLVSPWHITKKGPARKKIGNSIVDS